MRGPSVVEEALRLHEMGLTVLPAPADDGTSVDGVVKGFQHWRRRPPRDKVKQLCLGTGKLHGSEWRGAPWPACPRCEGNGSVPGEQRVGANDNAEAPAP